MIPYRKGPNWVTKPQNDSFINGCWCCNTLLSYVTCNIYDACYNALKHKPITVTNSTYRRAIVRK